MIAAIFSKLVSIFMLVIFILSILVLVLTFRKPKKITLPSLGITFGVSFISLVIFSALIGYQASFGTWFFMASIGGAIGFIWARTTQVYVENNQVMSRNSIWYLLVWGGVFTLNQLITIATNRPPNIGMALLILSTFIVWGTNGSIIQRYFHLRPALALQAAGAAGYGATAFSDYTAQAQSYSPAAQSEPARPSLAQSNPSAQTATYRNLFVEAAARYAVLKADFDRGALSVDAFGEALSSLRVQDAEGSWWQINEDGQSWLRWDGSAWVYTELPQG